MYVYTTGNILESEAECLVNTVNCEGYMGKGIAYQFKLAYPQNNKDYIKACKSGELRIGAMHYYKEKGKIIINFPTKDKWRKESKMEYIIKGLEELSKLITKLNITSIAMPPLGCGNGGLNWTEVKEEIIKNLSSYADKIKIYIYEPSKDYKPTVRSAPKLTLSHLLLMNIKFELSKFNSLRLQKSAYFMNLLLGMDYFKFEKYKYGPYAHSIEILSKSIKEFQIYHNTENTEDAYNIAKNTLISESIENKLQIYSPYLIDAVSFVNQIKSDKELELVATICFLIQDFNAQNEEDVILGFKEWSEEKSQKFTEIDIKNGIEFLIKNNVIEVNLVGFKIVDHKDKFLNKEIM